MQQCAAGSVIQKRLQKEAPSSAGNNGCSNVVGSSCNEGEGKNREMKNRGQGKQSLKAQEDIRI